MRRLSIGELAKAANVSIDTIRFYEKSGLLPQPARRPSGFREYSDPDLLQLQFIRRARAVGFSLEEIGELLALSDEASAGTIGVLIERKLALVNRKLVELEQWRDALRTFASARQQPLSTRRLLLHFSAHDSADVPASAPISMYRPLKNSHDEI